MSDKLIDRVSALLAEADNEVKDEFHNGEFTPRLHVWDCESVLDFRKQLVEAKINFDLVDRYGGEDQGSDYWCVWKFSKGDQDCFVKFYGWYASHYGTDYQGYKFVAPAQKTVIVYE